MKRNVIAVVLLSGVLVFTVTFVDIPALSRLELERLLSQNARASVVMAVPSMVVVESSVVGVEAAGSTAVGASVDPEVLVEALLPERAGTFSRHRALSQSAKQAAGTALALYKNNVTRSLMSRARAGGFGNYDLTTPSNLLGSQIDAVLYGTGLHGLGEAYALAERESGVNALFLVALSALESAWGSSYFARTRNNLFGFQAFTSNPGAAARFASKEVCIAFVAGYLKEHYLTVGGRRHRGFTARAVNVSYASDPEWHSKVTSIMGRLAQRLPIIE